MSIAQAIVADLRNDPAALAELRALVADTTPVGHLLRPEEAASRLGVSRRTVNRMATEGRIVAVKVGRGWRFPADELVVAPPCHQLVSPPPTPPRTRPDRPGGDRSSIDAIRGA